MPLRIAIDPAAKAVNLHFSGTVTVADFQAARVNIVHEPGWSPKLAHILDFTDVTALELSSEDIQKLAAVPPVFDASALQILVARPGSVHFGLSRMFQTYSETKRNVHVVDSMERALTLVAKDGAEG